PGYAGVIMSSEPAPLPPSPLDTWPPAWSPSAVVFDFDGLLVDTEAEGIRVQDAYLAMHDVRMDAARRREITGRAAEVVVAAIGALVGKDPQLVGDELLAAHREGLRTATGWSRCRAGWRPCGPWPPSGRWRSPRTPHARCATTSSPPPAWRTSSTRASPSRTAPPPSPPPTST